MFQRIDFSLSGASAVTPLSLAVAAAALLASYVVYNLYLHPLAGLSGPFMSRSGLCSFLLLRALKMDYVPATKALFERYPGARHIRIGRNRILTVDPDTVQQVYGLKTRFAKSELYSFIKPGKQESLFTTRDFERHARLRSQCGAAYAMKALLELEGCVDANLATLLDNLDADADAGRPVDLEQVFRFFAVDVVTDLGFGQPLGLIKARRDMLGVANAIYVNLNRAVALAAVPELGKPIMRAIRMFSDPASQLVSWAVECVQARLRRGDTERKDMLSTFMRSKDSATGKDLSLGQLLIAALPVLTAGSDTTAATLAAFIAWTHERPEVVQRLRDEVDESGLSMPPTYAESVKHLPYFHACLKEVMRLQAAVCYGLPRLPPAGGAVLGDGLYVPEGTEVTMSSWHYHRTAAAYGDDARQFRPERWMTDDEDERRQLERHNFSFGGGARICIGRHISIMEMSKALPTLLQRYKLTFTKRQPGSPHEHRTGRSVEGEEGDEFPYFALTSFLVYLLDFWVDIERRE
ncbi:uncharacterized protein PFL1_04400 [Pseudozyma flocculosa PF-1]|uniref:Cytochrome P450 n=2 Tax=Pseudozyma flocculosa TaxID=84751 RepID=A0A5C3FEW3_9BASI|nr:uncharacterized protein PFL1_04400 [Pseudozyma flocculosa PF-1]EPQ28073.1 hypothetical protein PFL1_04400 [Pseudozyma flocculosa PF-1]SPO42195.1 uncharacterized protein PSFLO_07678 [Pseudozyma flocculosa]